MTGSKSPNGCRLALTILLILAMPCMSAKRNSPSLRTSASVLNDARIKSAVTLEKAKTSFVTVSVAQTLFGCESDCMDNRASANAQVMFATFLNPKTFELTCGMFERKVDACFSKTFDIGCDPITNTATIDVYVIDETYKINKSTINPKIGRCKVGNAANINRAIKISESFECNGTPTEAQDVNPMNGTCTDTVDNCMQGTYCAYSSTLGYECRAYAAEGSTCGGRTLNGEGNQCNPDQTFCFTADSCMFADKPGMCVSYLGDCLTDKDCGDPYSKYCDESIGKCKARLTQGQCCKIEENQCTNGLSCFAYGAGYTCQNPRRI